MRTTETSKTHSSFLRIALQKNEAISLNTHLVQLTPLLNCNDVKQWAASFYLACTAPSGLVYYIIKDFFSVEMAILISQFCWDLLKCSSPPSMWSSFLPYLNVCVCVWWGGTGSAFSLWEQNDPECIEGQMVVQSEVYCALLIISVSFGRNNSAESLLTTIFIQGL